ncbi:MAG TPA: hypothetical protein VK646_00640 [Actinomycetota bacterium]|nr:hypothetical protein [Actinomycetota bacterium]
MKRSLPLVVFLMVVTSIAAFSPAAGARSAARAAALPPVQARADAWVRLCGFDHGCAFNKKPYLPTPYKGNNVYNTSGSHQTATGLMDEGTDIRFWVMLQNDSDQDQTLHVQGCGVPLNMRNRWRIREVLIGTWKVSEWHHYNVITKEPYATWAWNVRLAAHARQAITFELWNLIRGVNKVFDCRMSVSFTDQPDQVDTVIARSITF